MDKTSTGLTENVAGLLCYILGWVSGFVFILIEQENKFVRFHAMQSIISFGTYYHHHRGCPWFDTGYRHFPCLDSLGDIVYSVGRLNRYLSVPNVVRTLARVVVLMRD